MKDLNTKILILAVVVFAGFGCGMIESLPSRGESQTNNNAGRENVQTNGNANVADAARDALGLKKSGIPECDELIDEVAKDEATNSGAEETYAERLAKEFIKQQIFDRLNKDDANRTPAERQQLTTMCKKALESYRTTQAK